MEAATKHRLDVLKQLENEKKKKVGFWAKSKKTRRISQLNGILLAADLQIAKVKKAKEEKEKLLQEQARLLQLESW